MNHYFSHNGVDHANAVEAANHSAGTIIWTVIFVSLAVAAFIGAGIWAVKHFERVKVQPKGKEE